MVPLALGSQTNGSVIRPASFCGVYGFKPTHGLIPRHGMFQLSRTLDHVGLFAQHARGPRAARRAAGGVRRAAIPTRGRARACRSARWRRGAAAAADVRLREDAALGRRSEPDTQEAFAELVERLGDRVEEVELSPAEDACRVAPTHHGSRDGANLDREWEHGRDRLSASLRARIERGREVRALDYQRARARVPGSTRSFAELFEQRYDAILTPAAPGDRAPGPARRRAIRRSARCGRCAGCPRSACRSCRARTACRSACSWSGAAARRRAPAAHRALAREPGSRQLTRRPAVGDGVRLAFLVGNQSDPVRPCREFLAEEYEAAPVMASSLGLTEFDGRLDDLSAGAFEERRRRSAAWRERFRATPDAGLGPSERIDRDLVIAARPWPAAPSWPSGRGGAGSPRSI